MRSKIETDLLMGELIYKHLKGVLSADEKALLDSWLSHPANQEFFLSLKNSDRLYREVSRQQYPDMDSHFKRLQSGIGKRKRTRFLLRLAAVAALFIIGIGVCLLLAPEGPLKKETILSVYPVMDQTILQTAGGKTVYLADTVNKVLPGVAGKTEVLDTHFPVPADVTPLKYNILSTSSHGKIEMLLSDSSRVWLNAGSELRYPDVFGKNRRVVYLTGEAYFEVYKKADCPFTVYIGKTQIEVLGTEFNVKTLPAGESLTTLVKGTVQINNSQQDPVLLYPGQQAEVYPDGRIGIKEADVRYAIAWKKDQFAFRDRLLYHIIQELSEWYGFTFEFKNVELANIAYTAIIPRYPTVDGVLRILERTGDFVYTEEANKHIVIQKK